MRYSDKLRKRREERAEAVRVKEQEERKQLDEAERRRRTEEEKRRVYEMQAAKRREAKALADAEAENAALQHRLIVEAQRVRENTYGQDSEE